MAVKSGTHYATSRVRQRRALPPRASISCMFEGLVQIHVPPPPSSKQVFEDVMTFPLNHQTRSQQQALSAARHPFTIRLAEP